MENLNAEQIKKALERNIRVSMALDYDCPRITYSKLKDALALITSQEQRIKELGEELDDAKRDTIPKLRLSLERANAMGVEADKTIQKLTEENERLRANTKSATEILNFKFAYDAGKADTVRKMQERLKKQRFSDITPHDYDLLHCFIDGVAKEMLEGEEWTTEKL